MKKTILTIFFILMILIILLGNTYANIIVTEEALEDSFKSFLENSDSSQNQTETPATMTIDKDNKQITFASNEDTFVVNYDLSDKPTFTIDLSFNSAMTKDQWEAESNKTTILLMNFVLISDIAGVKAEDSMTYMFSKMINLSDLMSVSNSAQSNEYTDAISFAKAAYENSNNTLTDDLFTWSTAKVSESANEYKVQSTLTINNDADFTVMNGFSDKFGDDYANEVENSIGKSMQNNVKDKQKSVDNTIKTAKKLPQTGKYLELKDILYLLCISSSVILALISIKYFKYNNF